MKSADIIMCDISGDISLLIFIRVVNDGEITQPLNIMFYCKSIGSQAAMH